MMYVIKRTDQGGGWVSKPGSDKTYTKNLQNALVFRTAEQARVQCCENETVEAITLHFAAER
jgi:hypothetical protein